MTLIQVIAERREPHDASMEVEEEHATECIQWYILQNTTGQSLVPYEHARSRKVTQYEHPVAVVSCRLCDHVS